jgi:hypothetical protein
MKTSLYSNDGSLCSEAQFLLSSKPDNMSRTDWRKISKEFKSSLLNKDITEFERLKKIATNAKHYANNSEKIKLSNKRNKAKDPQKTKERNTLSTKKYRNKRMATDPKFRFFAALRTRCCQIVRDLSLHKKPTTTQKWIGCTSEELMSYIESLFVEGMAWENYGEWHVDHIRPVCSFSQEEWEQINHYTNLRPLWAEDNLAKIASDKQQVRL